MLIIVGQIPDDTNPGVAAKILKMVTDTLRIDKKRSGAVVDDISLLNFQSKDETNAKSHLQLGPPFNPLAFASVPVEGYPPQVGEDVNLNRVHKIAAMYMWTKVYVTKHGKLLGELNLETSLNKVRQDMDFSLRKKLQHKTVCTKCFTPTTYGSFQTHYIDNHLDGDRGRFSATDRSEWEHSRLDPAIMDDQRGLRIYLTAMTDTLMCKIDDLHERFSDFEQRFEQQPRQYAMPSAIYGPPPLVQQQLPAAYGPPPPPPAPPPPARPHAYGQAPQQTQPVQYLVTVPDARVHASRGRSLSPRRGTGAPRRSRSRSRDARRDHQERSRSNPRSRHEPRRSTRPHEGRR